MPIPVELNGDEVVEARPFTAAAETQRDVEVLRQMLARMRARAASWNASPDVLVLEPAADGLREWIRVPDAQALLSARELTWVGFFGRARAGVGHREIHDLEAGIVDTLERVVGVLSYYDLELADGVYGNLILCTSPEAPSSVHTHELHRRAVELTPAHYHSVRLHDGFVPGPLVGNDGIVLARTRYFDFDSEPFWFAVRSWQQRQPVSAR
jgi:hypothetical protein